VLRQFQLTPPHTIEEVSAYITAVYIAVAFTVVALTVEPTIVAAIMVYALGWR